MLSALGDVVHALPVVTAIKRHAPATHLTWILQPGPAALVKGHAAVDDILVFERRKGLRGFLDLRRALRERPFDLVLALQPYFKAGVITWMAKAPIKLGLDWGRARDLNWLFTTDRINPRPLGHIQDQFLEFLDAIGVPRGEPDWGLAPSAAETEAARAIIKGATRPLVGFVVATSKPRKNWPAERYAELATKLAIEHRARCVLLGDNSPLERAAADTILAHTEAAPIDALGIGLRATLALLKECNAVVSPDTGPFHMCVAMNVPAVGLYGYTNPKRFGPYGRFRDLMIDAYGDLGEDYPADAGYRPRRMERISVETVAEKVKLALGMQRA
ncbi:MAG: glycosyltransferase family 9 protein [Gemmatimonadales bacterium]